MKLELENGTLIENPGDSDIASALASVDRGDNSFVILSQAEMTYLQASGDAEAGFVLEYQQGSLAEHYRSTDRAIALDRATRTFQKYAKGDNTWRGETAWRRA